MIIIMIIIIIFVFIMIIGDLVLIAGGARPPDATSLRPGGPDMTQHAAIPISPVMQVAAATSVTGDERATRARRRARERLGEAAVVVVVVAARLVVVGGSCECECAECRKVSSRRREARAAVVVVRDAVFAQVAVVTVVGRRRTATSTASACVRRWRRR